MGVAALLTERITLRAPTRAPNGSGGWTNTYADAGTVNGRITASGSPEHRAGDEPVIPSLYEFVLDASVTVASGDQRLRDSAGQEYEIVGLLKQGTVVVGQARAV